MKQMDARVETKNNLYGYGLGERIHKSNELMQKGGL